jgi:AmpE protein
MNFLVVLICVAANYVWKRDLDRFDDSWFFSLRRAIEQRTEGISSHYPDGWGFGLLLIYLIPMVVLLLILLLISDFLFGFLTLLVHVFVLLVAIDRTQPGLLAEGYLQKWKIGDFEGCYLYLQQSLSANSGKNLGGDFRQLHSSFGQLYTYRCFEKMFVMLFWYVIAGPVAVLVCYITYQLRDGESEIESAERDGLIQIIVILIEWLPLRLLGLTFCLAGDFESCFAQLKKHWLSDDTDSSLKIYNFAGSALGLKFTEPDNTEIAMHSSPGDFKAFQNMAILEIDSLQALLERSQIIWVCLLALVAIFGLRF